MASETGVTFKSDTIGKVAAKAGVTVWTLRYYEDLGLLAPQRGPNGHRRYDANDIARLHWIRLLRELRTRVSEVDPEGADVLALTTRH